MWSASPPSDDLVRAIERAFARHQTSRELQNKQEFARARVRTLTPREREVFDRIIRGRTNKQIGRALSATERTIKAHRHGVMAKIQVRSLPEFVSVAERIRVLDGASDSRQTA